MRLWHRQPVRWAAATIWMALIFVMSAQSNLPDLAGQPDLQDIAGHFSVYAVLAWLLWQALVGAGVRQPGRLAFLLALMYGLSDELHQYFVPGRHPDLFDVATDAAGAAVALWSAYLWRRRQARTAPTPLRC